MPRADTIRALERGIEVLAVQSNPVSSLAEILFVRTAYTVEQFAARHLADLRAAAREIIASLPDEFRNR